MRWRRTTFSDRLLIGNESVVMVGNLIVHLSALPTAILDELDEWIDVTDVAHLLVGRFGPAPDEMSTLAEVEAALRVLETQALVERDG